MESLKEEITQIINNSLEKFTNEISGLKTEINFMKDQIDSLEKSNKLLIKEKNNLILKEFSNRLISHIDNNEFEKFKELIETHEYPIDDYFYNDAGQVCVDKPHLKNLNLLHYSIECNRIDFVNYLIERGADVNIPDKIDRWTPLMYAIEKEDEKLVELMLAKGANADYQDIDGFTPLAVCVDLGNKSLTKIILKTNPKLDVPKKIIPLAKRHNDPEILESITEYFGFRINLYDKTA